MLKKSLLLTSFLVSGMVLAEDELSFGYSGYLSNTSFSNTDFHGNRSSISLNLEANYNKFSLKTQLSTDHNLPVRRLTFEFANVLTKNFEYIYQFGRFSRVNSFYNPVLNSPSNHQMAMLPLAGYSYRMFNGSFVLMDGHGLTTSYRYNDNLFTLKTTYGQMVIDQESLQREAFKAFDENIEMRSSKDNYDIGIHFERKNWHLFWSKNFYQTNQVTESLHPLHKLIVNQFNKAEYDLEKVGLKFDNQTWIVSTEYNKGVTKSFTKQGVESSYSFSEDYYLIVGNEITERAYLYSGYSLGKNYTSNTQNKDGFIGFTYNYPIGVVVSLEYHKGSGKSWAKYDSSLNKWNTWVLSTSYQF